MRSVRLTCLLLLLSGGLILGAAPLSSVSAQDDMFGVAMRELSASTEAVLHELLRPDDEELQQAATEMREAASLAVSAATAVGFGEQELQDFLYVLEDAREVENFIAVGERGEALAVYYEMIDRCIACHQGL